MASMGPSMIVDGDTRAGNAAAAELIASMGPSMIVDGDHIQANPATYPLTELQWGRR